MKASRERSQRTDGLSCSATANTVVRPSGETAICGVGPMLASERKAVPSGRGIENRTAVCAAGPVRRVIQ